MSIKKTFSLFMVLFLVFCIFLIAFAPSVNAAVLKKGSTGSLVKTLQTKLKNWGYYKGSVDGIFGSKTFEAVKYFQRKNGLTVDGIVGSKTAAALGMKLNSSSTTNGSTISNSNLYLLSCCIYGEARGESYTGKVAIAAVVLNRVKSSSFPNTISGVIYQPGAFTAVSDGQINLGTNDECTRAAQDALNGWDPTYGSIYYYNPRTATNQWIKTRPVVVTIGNHVFCT
ncbi:MAG: spore cortex-lytic enzyme [Clostridia bacterium]|nr:spore cortex-lytic enzyme [Clostridia bacterium]